MLKVIVLLSICYVARAQEKFENEAIVKGGYNIGSHHHGNRFFFPHY